MMYSLAALVSPIFGGICKDNFGYKGTMDISAALMGVCSVLYLFFNCTCNVYQNTAKENKELERLKAVKEEYTKIRE